MKTNTLFRENLRISIQSIKSNLLRSILTILIITIGIMALVGILTAIESIKSSINKEFTSMGANTFTITSRGMHVQVGDKHYRNQNHAYISYYHAKQFKDDFIFPAKVSISTYASGMATIKHESTKTNPNINVRGIDEAYLHTAGYEITKGRNFSKYEIENNRSLVIIGHEIAKLLFPEDADPLDKIITIGNGKFKVIGILKEKGNSMGMSGDKICLLPVTTVRQYYSKPNMSFTISIMPNDPKLLDIAISEAEGTFRIVRNLDAIDETDFNITKSDNLVNILLENIQKVSLAATIIGLITLFGAAIGLMNIMLVAVSERTREIGTRKALGANSRMIKQQFLFEAVVIGQLGGIFGIIFGILIGNLISITTGGQFVIPWLWMIMGVILCLIVSLLSGLIPAVKAAKLDPIIALHYE